MQISGTLCNFGEGEEDSKAGNLSVVLKSNCHVGMDTMHDGEGCGSLLVSLNECLF